MQQRFSIFNLVTLHNIHPPIPVCQPRFVRRRRKAGSSVATRYQRRAWRRRNGR